MGSAIDALVHSSFLIPRYYALHAPKYVIPTPFYLDPSFACTGNPKSYADAISESALLYSLYHHNRERNHQKLNLTQRSNNRAPFASNFVHFTSETVRENSTITPVVRNTEFRRRAFGMLTNSSNTRDSKAILKPISHSLPKYADFTDVTDSLNRRSSPSRNDETASPTTPKDHPTIQLPAYLRTRINDDRLNSKSKNCRRSRTVFTEMQVTLLQSLNFPISIQYWCNM